MRIAFAIFGILLMCVGGGEIASTLYRKAVDTNPYQNTMYVSQLISSGIQFTVGLGLFFWAIRSLRVLTTPRDWGRNRYED